MVASDEFPQLGFPIFTGRTVKLPGGGGNLVGGEALNLKKMVCWGCNFLEDQWRASSANLG